jgi:uncharacterized membrane protein
MSRRGLLIALIVSLAVNLFVLGGVTGAVLMGFGRHPPPPPMGGGRLGAMGEALAPEHRDAWLAAVRTAGQSARPQLHQARELRRQAWQALAAEPADAQSALTLLDQSRNLELRARSEMDRAVVNFAATLPAAERGKLAQSLEQRMRPPHGPPWSGGGPGADHPPLPHG